MQHVSVAEQHYTRYAYTMLYVKCFAIKLGVEEGGFLNVRTTGDTFATSGRLLRIALAVPGADLSFY